MGTPVEVVRDHPAGRHSSSEGALQQSLGQGHFGCEFHRCWHPGSGTTFGILGPRPGEIERAVDEGRAAHRAVGEKDADLRVGRPTKRTTVLGFHAQTAGFFDVLTLGSANEP